MIVELNGQHPSQKVSEYVQRMPQSHTAKKGTSPQEIDTEFLHVHDIKGNNSKATSSCSSAVN